MVKVLYSDSITFVEKQVGVSHHQARQTIKEVSSLYQQAINKGNDIKVDGLFQIGYNITGVIIAENTLYGLNEMYEDLKEIVTNYDEIDTRNIVNMWLAYLKDKVSKGYTVSVKGVGTVLVEEDDKGVFVRGRISPQLDKPYETSFLVLEGRDMVIQEYKAEDLRLSISLDPDIQVPNRVQKKARREIEYVDIS